MTRTLLHHRYWDRVRERVRRRNAGVAVAYRGIRTPPFFTDYWQDIPGTLPEKMLLAELIRRQVNLYFSWYWGDMPFSTEKEERYRPDFILPDYKIIIEVTGYYWHTRPGMFEYDFAKYALYIAAGWKVYTLTDFEILSNPVAAIDNNIPELIAPAVHGNFLGVGDRPFDPKASALGRMRKFPKVVGLRYRKKVRGGVGVKVRWRGGKYIPRAKPIPARLFTHEDFSEAYVAELIAWGVEWKDWLDGLADYFVQYPEAATAYPDIWEMYNTWKDWWNRFSS